MVWPLQAIQLDSVPFSKKVHGGSSQLTVLARVLREKCAWFWKEIYCISLWDQRHRVHSGLDHQTGGEPSSCSAREDNLEAHWRLVPWVCTKAEERKTWRMVSRGQGSNAPGCSRLKFFRADHCLLLSPMYSSLLIFQLPACWLVPPPAKMSLPLPVCQPTCQSSADTQSFALLMARCFSLWLRWHIRANSYTSLVKGKSVFQPWESR